MDKKCYYVEEKDAGEGWAVVAKSPNQAKSFVHGAGEIDCDWTEMRVHLCYDDDKKPIVSPDDLYIGHIFEGIEGLKLGVYIWCEYADCPVCKQENIMVKRHDDGSVMCDDCWEAKEKENSP